MIRVQHEPLPAGLSAVVRRRPGGDTDVVVSTVLSPTRQRAAVRVGLRAARPADRRAALPVPLLGVLALGWAWTRAIARGLRFHPVAMVAAAGVVTSAAVAIAVVPHQHSAPPGGGGVPAAVPAPGQTAGGPAKSTLPAAAPQPSPSDVPVAAPSPAAKGGAAASPAPQVASSVGGQPSPSEPTPQPSPSPSGAGGGGLCLDLLGIWVCV